MFVKRIGVPKFASMHTGGIGRAKGPHSEADPGDPSWGISQTVPPISLMQETKPSTSPKKFGGADGIRTHDLLDAIEARSQLRHGPTEGVITEKL
jgi:hypothetical protein